MEVIEERLAELIRIMCLEKDQRKYGVLWREFVAAYEQKIVQEDVEALRQN